MAQNPITIIMNSGSGKDDKRPLRELIEEALASSGREVTFVELTPEDDFNATCESAVKKAKPRDGIIVAAGGDGTVNAVAALCHKHDVVMGVIPLGTFNYFARELQISAEPAKAVEVLISGVERRVSAGFIQEHIFLNNASFGLYTKIIRNREQDKSRFGRRRLVALISGIVSIFKGQQRFSIHVTANDKKELRTTTMVFVGNNTLQLENVGLEVAACTAKSKLAVVIVKETTHMETIGLLLRGALKNLKDKDKLEEFCADTFEVETQRRIIDMVIDGEIIRCRTPLSFRVDPQALRVMVPRGEPKA